MTIEEKVIKWARERNLLTPGNERNQVLKVCEEIWEYIEAGTGDEIVDAIGDIQVTLIILREQLPESIPHMNTEPTPAELSITKVGVWLCSLIARRKAVKQHAEKALEFLEQSLWIDCHNLGVTFEECLETAYETIKNRKGRTVDGLFVKEQKA